MARMKIIAAEVISINPHRYSDDDLIKALRTIDMAMGRKFSEQRQQAGQNLTDALKSRNITPFTTNLY